LWPPTGSGEKTHPRAEAGTVILLSARLASKLIVYSSAIMEAMPQSWSEDRLDELNLRVENGFIRTHEEMDRRFDKVDERFEKFEADVDKRFDKVDERFEKFEADVDKRFDKVDERFEKFEDDVNGRFDKVDKRFDKVDDRFLELNGRFDKLMFAILLSTGGMVGTLAVSVIAALLLRG
jgi:archaellum component FlaC